MILSSNGIKFLTGLFISLFFTFSSYSQLKEHNILVLHSYHQGLEWTDSISSGIQEVFKGRNDFNLIFEYLDTKRNFDQEYYDELYKLYRVKAKQVPFEAIIISDNAAYDFIKEYGEEFYPNIPVFYCGINNLDTTELSKYPNYRGIGERADHFATLSSILKIFPNRKNVLIINDNTLTGKAIKTELDGILNQFDGKLNFEMISDFAIDSLQEKVRNLDDSYVIYLLVINRDNTGKFISYREGISLIKEVSQVPIFGSWDFYKGKGLFGGKIARGKDQGRFVAKLALQSIEGKPLEQMKAFQFPEGTYIFDYHEMRKFDISHKHLPKQSIIINKHKRALFFFWILIATIVLLILILTFLLIRLRIRRANEKEMEKKIAERTVLLNEMNQQLTDIIIKKDKFFSILAHDLRGSVNIFLNFSMLLNEDDIQEDEEQSALIRKKLQISATQTYGLVEDLLYWGINQFTLSKNIEITRFTCQDLICNIIERFKLNLNNVQFKTNYEADLEIQSDINICQFIIRNIIQNAVKYSKKNGEIKLSTKKLNEHIIISIEDNGIGMDSHTIESIFSRKPIKKEGQKGENSTGLGLSTVLDYLDQINGKMEIDSTPQKGSVFRIMLPLQFNPTND